MFDWFMGKPKSCADLWRNEAQHYRNKACKWRVCAETAKRFGDSEHAASCEIRARRAETRVLYANRRVRECEAGVDVSGPRDDDP